MNVILLIPVVSFNSGIALTNSSFDIMIERNVVESNFYVLEYT